MEDKDFKDFIKDQMEKTIANRTSGKKQPSSDIAERNAAHTKENEIKDGEI